MEQSDIYSFCRGQMGADEYILWTGKPEIRGNLFTMNDFVNNAFGIFVIAFSLFWMKTAMQAPGPFFLSGLPFLAIGLYMLFGRGISGVYLRKRTAYVITNKRIYRRVGRKTDNLPGIHMPAYETVMHKNGNGSIRFVMSQNTYHSTGRYARTPVRYFTLENLADVDRAIQAIARMDTDN